MKNLISFLILVVFLSVCPMASGQNPVNNGSIANVIQDRFTRQVNIPGLIQGPEISVRVIYESNSTVVLQGDLITERERTHNIDLWNATDFIKDQYGFRQTQIFTSGVGSEGNPTRVYVVITK